MKRNKRWYTLVSMTLALAILIGFSGCYRFRSDLLDLKASVRGLPLIIQTYDDDANIIDHIEANSVQISSEDKFSIEGEEGEIISKSPVINLVIGGDSMIHVGSSLIAYDSVLSNDLEEYRKNVDINDRDGSIPFLNRMYNQFKSDWVGQKMIVLIRSQTGKPLATFVGDKVRLEDTEVDKSTSITIDGKRLFIYRCDYTIYELSLFEKAS